MMLFVPVDRMTTNLTTMLRTNLSLSIHGAVGICAGATDATTNKPECESPEVSCRSYAGSFFGRVAV